MISRSGIFHNCARPSRLGDGMGACASSSPDPQTSLDSRFDADASGEAEMAGIYLWDLVPRMRHSRRGMLTQLAAAAVTAKLVVKHTPDGT
ncbi:unnamed protein product [Cutaneotrichosporon oleaginosum]